MIALESRLGVEQVLEVYFCIIENSAVFVDQKFVRLDRLRGFETI